MEDKLKDLRISKGFSVAEMARMVGVKVQTYYKYESGARVPRRGVMAKISSTLGVSIETLFFAKSID